MPLTLTDMFVTPAVFLSGADALDALTEVNPAELADAANLVTSLREVGAIGFFWRLWC